MMYAVAYGNAFDGMATFGPFLTRADAIDFIEADGDVDFLIFEIDSPSNESKRNVNDLLGVVANEMEETIDFLSEVARRQAEGDDVDMCTKAMSDRLKALVAKCRETDQEFQ